MAQARAPAGLSAFQSARRLAEYGQEKVLDLLSDGAYLKDVAKTVGVPRPHLLRWLQGRLGTQDETKEDRAARVKAYKEARALWSESIVEDRHKDLDEETNDKLANLRKAQADFALKLAGVHNKEVYGDAARKGPVVNVNLGGEYLAALARINPPRVEEAEVIDVVVEPLELSAGGE